MNWNKKGKLWYRKGYKRGNIYRRCLLKMKKIKRNRKKKEKRKEWMILELKKNILR
jgi:hypothetical protein